MCTIILELYIAPSNKTHYKIHKFVCYASDGPAMHIYNADAGIAKSILVIQREEHRYSSAHPMVGVQDGGQLAIEDEIGGVTRRC